MLEIKHVSKSFPGVRALNDVSVEFYPGEIHALVGENGAGKSTLIKIICGIYSPDQGEVILNGKKLMLHSYRDAIDQQIDIVSQEIQVIPKSTIAENIMLDKLEKYRKGLGIDWKKINEDAVRYIEMVELNLPATTLVGGLSAAQKQLIMIARALSADAKVLVLDEPTSALTLHETDNLLELLKKIKQDGVTIIFVSHKLEEVLQLADKVSVLRDGNLIGTKSITGLMKADIVTMMIGRAARTQAFGSLQVDQSHAVLEARDIYQGEKFKGLSFCLNQGEILGFYGLVGSGRTELAQILIGEARKDGGHVFVDGRETHIRGMADSLYKYRMGYVSENRKEKGLILSQTIRTNTAITVWNRLVNGLGAIDLRKENQVALEMMQSLDVKATGPDQTVNKLSGGNQQKVSIAKWLAANCDILIVDEPTIGVDIGAKEYIHQLIWNLAKEEGKSIILISSDMPEIVSLARRILVFKDYQIVGEVSGLNTREYTYEEVSQEIGKYLA
ncbi:MAG TPA: sugar ABC transporter ATP-binding protein [Anaerolineales bacterium]